MTVCQASSSIQQMVTDQTVDQWQVRLRTKVGDSGRRLKHFKYFYYSIALLVHTFSHLNYDVSFKCSRR